MGGRGSAYKIQRHIGREDNIPMDGNEFIDDPETEYHNEMFDKLKENHISTRKSTDDVDDKILARQQTQIYKISSKYNDILKSTTQKQDIQFATVNIKNKGVLGYCSVALNDGQSVQRIVLDKKQLRDYDDLVKEVVKGVEIKQFVPIDIKFKSRDYIITHELGHAIENSLIEREREKQNLVSNNFNDFRKFRRLQATKIRNEVMKIWKNKYTNNQEYDTMCLSEYSKKNDFEWFAETFTNLELADKPAPIALALGEYLKEKNR